jgi:predicted AlkP superfamily phosphohydrolase/phosphomutase
MTEKAFDRESSPEVESNLKQKIIEAVLAEDIEQLIRAIETMNTYLTGDSKLGVPNQISSQEDDLKKFLKSFKKSEGKWARAYIYLGDGGVSRLSIYVEDQNISLAVSSVSTERVKEKWAQLQ